MSGWLNSLVCVAIFLGLAVALERCAATRWFHHLAIAGLALALLRPLLAVTGDMSTLLPDFWSADADGKDQIIVVSVAATLTFPVIVASLLVTLARAAAVVWTAGASRK